MFRLALKVLVVALLFSGVYTFLSSGAHAYAAVNCNGAPYTNWGNRGGDGQGLMASMMTYAQDEDGNPINTNYIVNTSFSDPTQNAKIFKWPIGSSGREAQHEFRTGEHLYGDGGYDCNGWSVLAPGTDGHVGNQYVIDCGDAFQHTKVWISHVDNPGGAAGTWELRYNGGTILNDVNNSGPVKFDVNNGGNVQLKLIWHPAPPTGNVSAQCGQNNINVSGVNNRFSGTPQSYVVLTNSGGASPDRFPATGYFGQNSYSVAVPAWVKNRTGATNVGVQLYVKGSDGKNYLTDSKTIQEPWSSCQTSSPQCTTYHVDSVDGYLTYVSISGTDNDQNRYEIDPGGNGHTFTYTALNPSISITTDVYHNVGTAQRPNWQQVQDPVVQKYDCYHASCQVLSVSGGTAPGGRIEAGQNFTANVYVINDNPSRDRQTIKDNVSGYDFSLTEPPGNGHGFISHPTNFSLSPGQSNVLPISVKALSTAQDMTLTFYPDLYNHGALGPNCTFKVPIFESFVLTPHSTLDYSSAEDPGTIGYKAYVNNKSGSSVSAPSTSTFKVTPYGGGSRCANVSTDSSGPYKPGDTTTMAAGTCNPSSVVAGDQYCTNIVLNYNSGYVGPDGTPVGTGTKAGVPLSDQHCFTVTNKPYFKVYNGGVSAGGDFKQADGTCSSGTDGGVLAGWNSNSGGADRGAGSQLSALAMIKITGFASAQTTITRSPTDLSFANTVPADISTSNDSPSLGGNYNPGGSLCLTDATPPSGAAVKPGGYVQPGVSGIANNRSVFVNGDVYISNNITYANTWATDSPPSFVLRATGNIYIAPGVTHLDGLYISKNKIYTCSVNNGGGNFAPVARQNIYNTCWNQLVVFGNFVAKQVNLLRSYGSLRDEKPTPGTPPTSGTNGALGPLYYNTAGIVVGDKDNCVNIEPSRGGDRDWKDNYLCPSSAVDTTPKLGFSENSNDLERKGLTNCTDTWSDVLRDAGYDKFTDWRRLQLCSNLPVSFGTNVTEPGKFCTRIFEPSVADFPAVYVCIASRVSGSPGTPPTAPASPACSNRGSRLVTNTCAGEVFFLNPSLYYAKPNIPLPNGGCPSCQFDSITSLPPVL